MQKRKTYIFIDESGDFGVKMIHGSTRFIVLVAIIFEDGVKLAACESKIKQLKDNLRLSDNFEFKFSKLSNKFRLLFLSKLNECDYGIYYSYKDKTYFMGNSNDLYTSLFNELFKRLSSLDGVLSIKIDGKIDNIKKKEIIVFLRQIISNKKIKIAFINSKNSIFIQCADMVAGSIRLYYESSNKDYFNKIKKKII